MKNFLVHDEKTTQQMCEDIGINAAKDLFAQIPQDVRMQRSEEHTSELQSQR